MIYTIRYKNRQNKKNYTLCFEGIQDLIPLYNELKKNWDEVEILDQNNTIIISTYLEKDQEPYALSYCNIEEMDEMGGTLPSIYFKEDQTYEAFMCYEFLKKQYNSVSLFYNDEVLLESERDKK